MDNRSKEARSKNMSHIPSKILNRKKLCASIFSARGSDTERMCLLFLGNPILCFQNIKRSFLLTDAFGTDTRDVNGLYPPKTNTEFWNAKFQYNIERDKRNYSRLEEMGWRVLIVWECEIRHSDSQKTLINLCDQIKEVKP